MFLDISGLHILQKYPIELTFKSFIDQFQENFCLISLLYITQESAGICGSRAKFQKQKFSRAVVVAVLAFTLRFKAKKI